MRRTSSVSLLIFHNNEEKHERKKHFAATANKRDMDLIKHSFLNEFLRLTYYCHSFFYLLVIGILAKKSYKVIRV